MNCVQTIGQLTTFEWPGGRVSIQPLGAMIAELILHLEDGRTHQPLHRAPWVDSESHGQSGLMAGLSGEWPCVPFGAPADDIPPHWQAKQPSWQDAFAHGTCSHVHWDISTSEEGISAQVAFPDPHPIESLRRSLRPISGGIAMTLTITPRRDCALPIGLHPVFSLPQKPGQMSVNISGADTVWSHPADPGPDPTPVAPGQQSSCLSSVATATGGTIDLSRLPLETNSETRLLVPASGGQVHLTNHEDHILTTLHYNAAHFPALMLWISNRGRKDAPWSGRHLALGVEPVRACFDLGVGASQSQSPLNDAGIPTVLNLRAGECFATVYAITSAVM